MSQPQSPLLKRVATQVQQAVAAPFEPVPTAVRRRIRWQSLLGAGLIVLGFLAVVTIVRWVIGAAEAPGWVLTIVLLAVPGFLVVFGANLVSAKYTAAALGSVAALVRALKGQPPPAGPPPAS